MASMPDAWRIDREKWSGQSFSGHGAALAGGRWNPPGMRVVYASQHLATAAWEKFVHLPKPIPDALRFVRFAIWFRGVAIERPSPATLPPDWRSEPVGEGSQEFGAAWLRSGRTAVVAVPCVLLPEEENYLINPSHPEFTRIEIGPPEPFEFGPRLAALRES